MGRRRMAMTALVGLLVLVGACGSSGGSNGGAKAGTAAGSKAGTVNVTLKDFAISPNLGTVKSGPVTFDIENKGPSQHEFVVIRSDFTPAQLPLTQEQGVPIVDEEAAGLEGMGEREDINSGANTTLSLNLAPGHYLLICNLPSHFKLGMVAQFTVAP